MTLFHFGNCVVLAYAPFFIAYKYSSLSDYMSIWKCAQAAVIYFLTQFCKMMVMATFFPASSSLFGDATPLTFGVDVNDSYEFNLTLELIKSSVDVIDVIGLHLAIGAVGTAGKGATRFFAAGLGWAAAHALSTTFVALAFGARTAGFQWTFVQASLGANMDLIFYMSMAALVWTFNRGDLSASGRNFVCALIVLCVFHDVIYQVFAHIFLLRSWILLGAKAGFVTVIFLSALTAYAQIGSGYSNTASISQNANIVAASYGIGNNGRHHKKN